MTLHTHTLPATSAIDFCACLSASFPDFRLNYYAFDEFVAPFSQVLTLFNGCVAAMDADSDSGSDFGGFASDDLGGNEHVAAALGTGSDVDLLDWDVNNGDSSDTHSDSDDGNASLTWTSAATDVVVDPFRPQQVGPAILLGPQAKPVDYFLAMFDISTFVVMAKQTNLYATQFQGKAGKRDESWTPTPEDGKEMPEDGKEMPEDGKETPEDGKEMPEDGKEMPEDGKETPEDGKEMPEDGKEMPEDGKETPEDGKEMPEDGKEMSEDGKEMPEDGKEMPEDGKEMPEDGKEMPEDGKEMPEDGKEMPEDGKEMPEDGKETPEDGKEMRTFFAVNIMMGIISLPSYEMY